MHIWSWIIGFLVSIWGVSWVAAVETVQLHEDFAQDPKWEGRNNRPDPAVCRDVKQDFGFSPTSHAGGTTGEIGGRVCRSLRLTSYAKPVRPRTLNDRLHASGRLAVTQSDGGSGTLIGWFNSTSRGWRTPNSLVFRVDGEQNKFRVFFEYGTQTWKTGGGATFEGEYQTTKTPMIPADGSPHTWSLDCDPAGAGGAGEIVFTLDGQVFQAALADGHKTEGAVFDRFGIMNVQISGKGMTLWLDDLDIDGEKESFSRDPAWEGRGNRDQFRDCAVRPFHDFGFHATNLAGGQPGEIGGLVWRIESTGPQEALLYGTPIGQLSLNDRLEASGRLCLKGAAADSAIIFGWFNSYTPIGIPPPNFLGCLVEGPSRIGHYVRPACGDSCEQRIVKDVGPIIRPDGRSHEWTVDYDPQGAGGRGLIRVSLDGQEVTTPLRDGMRKSGAAFDRFGFLSWHRGGHFVEIYFDDLRFTAQAKEK